MKTIKRTLAVLLTLLMLVSSVPYAVAKEEATSGKCGDNAYWSYDEDTATLMISGTGDMWDHSGDEVYDLPYGMYKGVTESIRVLNGITRIGSNAFLGFVSYNEISLPNSLQSIGDEAFYGCDKLESIVIPDSVKTLGDGVFYGGSWGNGLKNVVLGNGLTEVPSLAFCRCFSLETVTLGRNIRKIGESAFSQCHKLSKINLPDSLMEIDGEAFYQCYSLEDIHFGSKIQSICGFVGSGLKKLKIPDQVKTIGRFAFERCLDLEKIDLGNGVQVIEDSAFGIRDYHPQDDVLHEVTIPKSVRRIEGWAFYGRSFLEKITFLNPDCEFVEDEEWEGSTIIPDETVIYGYENSTAQKYAETYGLAFVKLEGQPDIQPDQTDETDKTDTNLIQRLIEWIRNFFAQILRLFNRQPVSDAKK